ncbi:hypothetical protein TcCL_NonESM08091, partial [Trypanosoma cruzi]
MSLLRAPVEDSTSCSSGFAACESPRRLLQDRSAARVALTLSSTSLLSSSGPAVQPQPHRSHAPVLVLSCVGRADRGARAERDAGEGCRARFWGLRSRWSTHFPCH